MKSEYLYFIVVVIILSGIFGLISKSMDSESVEEKLLEAAHSTDKPTILRCDLARLDVEVHFMIVQGNIRSEVSCQKWYRVPWERRELKLCDSNRVCQIILGECND